MSFKIKLDNLSRNIEDKIQKSVEVSIDKQLAQETADQIKIRTRLGYGIGSSGEQVKLKKLSDSYRSQRNGDIVFYTDRFGRVRRFDTENRPDLHRDTTPTKSNATRTGQMLNSLTGEAKNTQIFISLKGLRDDGYSNEQIAEYVENQGRFFMGLTNSEKNALARKLKNRILSSLK